MKQDGKDIAIGKSNQMISETHASGRLSQPMVMYLKSAQITMDDQLGLVFNFQFQKV